MNCFLDYDSDDMWYTYVPKGEIWETNIEMVEIEARRLHFLFPQLGNTAIIRKSSIKGNYHLLFTKTEIDRWEDIEAIMLASQGHFGHIRYSCAFKDATLRMGPKRTAGKPYTVRIIRFGDEA